VRADERKNAIEFFPQSSFDPSGPNIATISRCGHCGTASAAATPILYNLTSSTTSSSVGPFNEGCHLYFWRKKTVSAGKKKLKIKRNRSTKNTHAQTIMHY